MVYFWQHIHIANTKGDGKLKQTASQWKTRFGKWPVIVHRYLLEKDH